MEDMPLTEKQGKMMDLVCQGYTYQEIGKVMFWADSTIRHTLTWYIFPKLKACNRSQAVAHWIWLKVCQELTGRN